MCVFDMKEALFPTQGTLFGPNRTRLVCTLFLPKTILILLQVLIFKKQVMAGESTAHVKLRPVRLLIS